MGATYREIESVVERYEREVWEYNLKLKQKEKQAVCGMSCEGRDREHYLSQTSACVYYDNTHMDLF